jgi:hypothetical protein
MTDQSFTTTFMVDQFPDEVFAAINDVRGWWSGEIEGDTDRLGGEFTYRYEDIHRSTQKITELVPGNRVVWHVTDAYLSFIKDTDEWTGTDIVFDIAEKDDRTEVRFTHVGLVPEVECYDRCTPAWSFYIAESLHNLIASGQGEPNEREAATA